MRFGLAVLSVPLSCLLLALGACSVGLIWTSPQRSTAMTEARYTGRGFVTIPRQVLRVAVYRYLLALRQRCEKRI
jgi:hypothetical protein